MVLEFRSRVSAFGSRKEGGRSLFSLFTIKANDQQKQQKHETKRARAAMIGMVGVPIEAGGAVAKCPEQHKTILRGFRNYGLELPSTQ